MNAKLQMDGPAYVLADRMKLKEIYVYEGDTLTLNVSLHLVHMATDELVDVYLFTSYADMEKLISGYDTAKADRIRMAIVESINKDETDDCISMRTLLSEDPELLKIPLMLRRYQDIGFAADEDIEEEIEEDNYGEWEEGLEMEAEDENIFEIEYFLQEQYEPFPLPYAAHWGNDMYDAMNDMWGKYCQALVLHGEIGYPLDDMLMMMGLYHPHTLMLCESLYKKVFSAPDAFENESQPRDEDLKE